MDITTRAVSNMERFHICKISPVDDLSGFEINNNRLPGNTCLRSDPRLDKENDDGYSSIKQQKKRSSAIELEQEIATLKRNLRHAQTSVARAHEHMELQKLRTRQLISAWKQRLEDGEDHLRQQRGHLDDQMKAIATELLRFEGRLRGEQKDIHQKLEQKDTKIRQQQQVIDRLLLANGNLTKALKKVRRKLRRHEARKAERALRKKSRAPGTGPKIAGQNSESSRVKKNIEVSVHNKQIVPPRISVTEERSVLSTRSEQKVISSNQKTKSIKHNPCEHSRLVSHTRNKSTVRRIKNTNIMRSKSLPNFDLSVLEEEPEVFEESYVDDLSSGESRATDDGLASTKKSGVPEESGYTSLTRTKSDSLVRRMVKSEGDLERDGLCRTSSLSLNPTQSNCSTLSIFKADKSSQEQCDIDTSIYNTHSISFNESAIVSDNVLRTKAISLSSINTDADSSLYQRRSYSQSNLVGTSSSKLTLHDDELTTDTTLNTPVTNTLTEHTAPSNEEDPFEITWSLTSSPNLSDVRPVPKRIQKPRDVKRRNKLRSQSDASGDKKPNPVQTKRYHTSII